MATASLERFVRVELMSLVDIRVLGAFEARIGLTPLPELGSGRMRALVTYLVLEADRAQLRSSLAALFWPDLDETAALRLLRQTLYRLAALLDVGGQAGAPLRIDRHTVQLDTTLVRVDARIIEDARARVRQHGHRSAEGCRECRDVLDLALGMYRGELLDGIVPVPGDRFDDWLVERRARLMRTAAELYAIRVAQAIRRCDDADAIDWCSAWLRIDPWNEQAHRQLALALAYSGRRTAALRQLEACRQMLLQEFGASLPPELAELGAQIRQHALTPRVAAAPPSPAGLGREHERATLLDWLNQPLPCLICVSGMGGIGKSHLIADLDAELHVMFDGRVVLVDCHGITQPERLWQQIVRRCGAHGITLAADTPADAWHPPRDGLLILDGLDGDPANAALVLDVRGAAPWLSVLTTQRRRLALVGAAQLNLGGLAPEAASAVLDRCVARDAAVRISPAHCLALCVALDGVPLALELVAPLLRLYLCDELCAMIEAGELDMLVTTLIDVPPRQRSLTAIFAATLAVLDDAQRSAFVRLAALGASFQREDAAALLGAAAATELLSIAGDWSLLATTTPGRYQIPGVLRRWLLAHAPPS